MKDESASLIKFFSGGQNLHFAKGEIIIRGDDSDLGVYYISGGFVRVYSINDEGEEYTHVVYGKGEIFPLIWAIAGTKRQVFYESMSQSELWRVSRHRFINHIKSHTDAVSMSLLQHLTDQFNIYADRIDNLQYKSAYQRVVYRILFLASRFGKKNGKTIVIDIPLTHKILAQSINLARESVSREIEKLVEDKLIEVKRNHIVILDVERLKNEFSQPVSLNLWGLSED